MSSAFRADKWNDWFLHCRRPRPAETVISRPTVQTVVETLRHSAGCGLTFACPHLKRASPRLYLVAQLTTAVALASWHTAPVIPSKRRVALSPVQ
jgi:hypothetical protein